MRCAPIPHSSPAADFVKHMLCATIVQHSLVATMEVLLCWAWCSIETVHDLDQEYGDYIL